MAYATPGGPIQGPCLLWHMPLQVAPSRGTPMGPCHSRWPCGICHTWRPQSSSWACGGCSVAYATCQAWTMVCGICRTQPDIAIFCNVTMVCGICHTTFRHCHFLQCLKVGVAYATSRLLLFHKTPILSLLLEWLAYATFASYGPKIQPRNSGLFSVFSNQGFRSPKSGRLNLLRTSDICPFALHLYQI